MFVPTRKSKSPPVDTSTPHTSRRPSGSFAEVEIRHLTALRAVAEEGSFIGAADLLGFSQAAISQQIAGLERAVGHCLFDRPGGPRPVTITPAGRLLLAHAKAILGRLDRAQGELADLTSGTAGRLVCGTFQSVSAKLVPELVRELRADAPDLDIHLIEQDRNDSLVNLLLAGEIDVTFLEGPYEDSRLEITELGIDPFVVLLPAGSEYVRLAKGRTFPTAALLDAPMVGEHPCSTQTRIDDGLRLAGVHPRYVFRSSDNGAIQGMVRAGLGPAVMPLLAVDPQDPGVVIKSLDPPIEPRRILIALRRSAAPLPAAERFVKIAKRECRKRLRPVPD